ncbi:MAG: hypothetical protein ACJAVR_002574 [Paracoccaceae bacterium]|jgi:uncharacterized protein YfaS (alpha-2-macroglobulin family)
MVLVTDLGLTAMTGEDGLHVFARALSSAEASAGLQLWLIARNNEVLGEAMSDADGYARFAPGLTRGQGGSAPALVKATAVGGDFAFLDLSRPSFDLSDRGVGGRAPSGPVDVFATTERGAYRPGETVHATILARDPRANAIEDLSLTAIAPRPDGVEHSRSQLIDQGAGGRAFDIALDPEAQRGTWRMAIHADAKAPALANAAFLVEDFMPERIDFDLTAPDGPVAAADGLNVSVAARYLHGGIGAGLAIEGETRVSASDTMAAFPGFAFGLHDEQVNARLEALPSSLKTDAQGRATVPLRLPKMAPVTKPLKITAIIRARDTSGRPVERTLTRALMPNGPRIGIKPLFDGTAEEGSLARFEMIAVGALAQRIALDRVAWTLSRVETRYQWYKINGSWNYEPLVTRKRVASGESALNSDAATLIEAPVRWGRYELKVINRDGAHTAASVGFAAGWHTAAGVSQTPDRLEVGLDKPAYQIGDTARVRLVSRSAGKALVMVMDGRLIDMRAVDVMPGETVVELPVTDA